MTLIGALIVMASLIVLVAGGAFLATILAKARLARAQLATTQLAPAPPPPSPSSANGVERAAPSEPLVAAPVGDGGGNGAAHGDAGLDRERAALDERKGELERAERLRNLLV